MRQVFITKAGPPEVLQVRESPDPVAGPGEVRVRVKAAGINFADLMARLGIYPDAPKIPCVVGYEVSGIVDQIGPDTAGFTVGDRIFGMTRFGGYSDTVVIPAERVFRMPEKMTFEEGAALPVVYLTAHHMLLFTGNLRPGMKVLLHSAAGGVGLAAIDLLVAHGCEIIGTASPGKHQFLKDRGVQHCIDSTGDVYGAVRALLGGDGKVDLICDPIGGVEWGKNYKLLGPGGRLVCFGASNMAGDGKRRSLWSILKFVLGIKWWNPIQLMTANKTVTGVNMYQMFDHIRLVRPQFEALVRLYEAGQIHPFVDKTFPFAEASAAHHYLHDRKARGKLLLVP
ncbi:MAG: Alcohol dehydrogenase zinc-binding domain protein [Myxococcales bacterium]|nr:Alcohol dehydrogenase zinc-binding domain protein [Myxococcales bacterium]